MEALKTRTAIRLPGRPQTASGSAVDLVPSWWPSPPDVTYGRVPVVHMGTRQHAEQGNSIFVMEQRMSGGKCKWTFTGKTNSPENSKWQIQSQIWKRIMFGKCKESANLIFLKKWPILNLQKKDIIFVLINDPTHFQFCSSRLFPKCSLIMSSHGDEL